MAPLLSGRWHTLMAANGSPRVLLVDDDSMIRVTLAEALEDEGYKVETAGHGREALEMISAWRPDVIVLDLMMPIMDGWAFRAEQMRRGLAENVPVVVLSAARTAAEAARDLAAQEWVQKPFDFDALLNSIARVTRPSA
jgi:CheY-like chemotaxis protein